MKNPVYLSTGAFTGRINGRNYHLLTENADCFNCDGFEFMMFEDYYPYIDSIVAEYKNANINVPVMHADKLLCSMLTEDIDTYDKATELFRINLQTAKRLSAGKIVFHAWGAPTSDGRRDLTCDRLGPLLSMAQDHGIEMLIENVICRNHGPLSFLEFIKDRYPDTHFIIDTRHAQFHRELEKTLDSGIFKSVHHIHIGDYKGSYMDWSHWNASIRPGQGDVDWAMFFSRIKDIGYTHSFTVEAASVLEQGVDTDTLNESLSFVRSHL